MLIISSFLHSFRLYAYSLLSKNYTLKQHVLIVFTKNNDEIIAYIVEERLGRGWQLMLSYGDLKQKNIFCIQVIGHWFENKGHDFFVCLVMSNHA